VQRLELLPDFLLRPAEDFPPDPLAVGPEAKRDDPTYRFFAIAK
jgi:hypothetical protein